MLKSLATLALTAVVSFLPAAAARADVYMLEVLSLQPGVSPHHADSYLGALDLVARRHGGVRVSRFRATTKDDVGVPRLVGLWRFPNPGALDALLADPTYEAISRLRQATFGPPEVSALELVAERVVPPN
jgi:hypothetical protein